MTSHHRSDRLQVFNFDTRDELTRYFRRLDRYLAQRLGTDYATRAEGLELWANTDAGPASGGARGVGCGPCLYANDALLDLLRWGRLGRAPAYSVPRSSLPRHAWPVLGPHAYPSEAETGTSRIGLLGPAAGLARGETPQPGSR